MDLNEDKIEIEELVLKKTNHCAHSFECLKNENHHLNTEAERCLNGEILFVNCSNRYCNYKMNFGNSTTCYCPTRKEIFKKYKK